MRIIIFVLILATLYSVSFAQSAKPSIFCNYGGALVKSLQDPSYTFSVDDVPERCDVVSYGGTFFNSPPDEEDAKAIAELKSAGKTVYMLYMNESEVEWANVISSTDPTVLDNYIAPMLKYVTENSIDGIILAYLELFSGGIPDYTTKIYGFLCKIKECAPNLKISILVSANDPKAFDNNEIFDFTVINNLVDIYFIDTTLKNYCDASVVAANGGRLPITSNGAGDNRFTLVPICTHIYVSGADVSKLYVVLNDVISKEIPGSQTLLPYSKYCAGPVSETEVYCLDTIKQFYDTAKYAKNYFQGMMIYQLDFDDYNNSCSCGLFPVANAYIDAWKNEPIKCCDRIG